MKRTLVVIALLAISGCEDRATDHVTTAWDVYWGEIPGYAVEIDESQLDHLPARGRLVRLRPILEQATEQAVPFSERCGSSCGITGHDYTADGRWDRVFLCGYPDASNGCNAIAFYWDKDSAVPRLEEWEPCSANKDDVQRFSQEEVAAAVSQLDAAMRTIHRIEHRVWDLEEYRARSRASRSANR
ncbi:hypothetical protein HY634_01300 [Candidatus Uhrbacteria bacterium]|nr:hypothetical protein [Candidatus Uhrbacteria bacterium]